MMTGMVRKELSAGVVLFSCPALDSGLSLRRYLLLHTGKFWDFPKGHLKQHESHLQAALRELHEEAAVSEPQIIPGFAHEICYYFRDGKHLVEKTVVFFLGWTSQQTMRVSDEHVEYALLDYEQSLQRLTYANTREILKLAHAFERQQ